MPKYEDMTDKQLDELLQGCYRYMASLTVHSQVPAEDRAEYRAYERICADIEREQDRRYHPSIALQDELVACGVLQDF